ATDVEDVRILTELPQTGLGGFIGSGASGTLSPSQGITSETGTMTMFILWTSIISIGLTAGSVLGRRMFI
ncbi:MAG: hypothetical protein O2904_04210, partial [bacterium]|nr:hypothetical protein [bacterium]